MAETSNKSNWTEIGNLAEFSDFQTGETIVLELERNSGRKQEILLVKISEKEFHALDNVCTHDDGPLDDGKVNLSACSIECSRHGARFDIKSGKVIRMPAVQAIHTYPVKLENNILYTLLPD